MANARYVDARRRFALDYFYYNSTDWRLYFCTSGYVFSPSHTSLTQINANLAFSFQLPENTVSVSTSGSDAVFMADSISVVTSVNSVAVESMIFAWNPGFSAFPIFFFDNFDSFTTKASGQTRFNVSWPDNIIGAV